MVIGFFPEKLLLESAYDVGSVTIRLTMTPQKVMIREFKKPLITWSFLNTSA